MGHKVHPIGFRLGILYPWQSKWFADKNYTNLLHEDLSIRKLILTKLSDASVSRVELERNANQVIVTIHTAKPGIVIGRGGQKVDELRTALEKLSSRRVRVNIVEIRQPELDAYLVSRSVAEQLERRVAFRRAMKQAVTRTMQRGACGARTCTGAGARGGGGLETCSSPRGSSTGSTTEATGGAKRTPATRSRSARSASRRRRRPGWTAVRSRRRGGQLRTTSVAEA